MKDPGHLHATGLVWRRTAETTCAHAHVRERGSCNPFKTSQKVCMGFLQPPSQVASHTQLPQRRQLHPYHHMQHSPQHALRNKHNSHSRKAGKQARARFPKQGWRGVQLPGFSGTRCRHLTAGAQPIEASATHGNKQPSTRSTKVEQRTPVPWHSLATCQAGARLCRAGSGPCDTLHKRGPPNKPPPAHPAHDA